MLNIAWNEAWYLPLILSYILSIFPNPSIQKCPKLQPFTQAMWAWSHLSKNDWYYLHLFVEKMLWFIHKFLCWFNWCNSSAWKLVNLGYFHLSEWESDILEGYSWLPMLSRLYNLSPANMESIYSLIYQMLVECFISSVFPQLS